MWLGLSGSLAGRLGRELMAGYFSGGVPVIWLGLDDLVAPAGTADQLAAVREGFPAGAAVGVVVGGLHGRRGCLTRPAWKSHHTGRFGAILNGLGQYVQPASGSSMPAMVSRALPSRRLFT